MDPRTAAHVLSQIALFLELRGEPRFKARAYANAARALLSIGTDDLRVPLESGELEQLRGIGPATLSVIRELVETGESSYLDRLRGGTPEGLLDLLRVPGLRTDRIWTIHSELGVGSLDGLEAAARDGSLAKLKGFGPKTAARILKGITMLASSGARMLLTVADGEAMRVLSDVAGHPSVVRAEIAGSVRRRNEVVADIDVVAACDADPRSVAESFARAPGVREAVSLSGAGYRLTYVDGLTIDLHCTTEQHFAAAWWRATGSERHVAAVTSAMAERKLRLEGDILIDEGGGEVPLNDEAAIYSAAGMAYVAPEMREDRGEIEMAASGALPKLITFPDISGILHCHSTWSDGKGSIAEMAAAAAQRGWKYIGISDHSVSAFYAGGLKPESVREQHAEIDALNASGEVAGVRVLKGIEADILPDGRVDYDEDILASFDYVIASVHSRFSMEAAEMTRRILTALDNPFVTILAHPTGRLLLNREPYAVDVEAVLDKAAEVGAAVELNADPHRLDLDWRYLGEARARPVQIAIGPDAHSTRGLDNMWTGISMARKGGLTAADVLNTRPADDVIAFAKRRRG
jgi:DNA polymerase (family X)